MKFLVDAHLPKSLCRYFEALGHEAFHTSRLPAGNATADAIIAQMATDRGCIVVSKDTDFYHSFLLKRMPPKLVMVKVGNMKLAELRVLFEQNAATISELLEQHDLIEVHRDRIIAIA